MDGLSDELVLGVLAYTDVPDILSFSRTCRRFRRLSLDPVLHAQRRNAASARLSISLSQRPPLAALLPPRAAIYLSASHVLARRLSRQLVAIRLARRLARRPDPSALVESNILPRECARADPHTGAVVWGAGLAPALVDTRRRVERERVKDGLRAWLGRRAEAAVRSPGTAITDSDGGAATGVRGLVRRFTSKRFAVADGADPEMRWGRGWLLGRARRAEEPTRAHVYGLRRFWEGLAKSQQSNPATLAAL